ncbi:LysR family transcriptional regulator, partial [Rhizobium calliandrae]
MIESVSLDQLRMFVAAADAGSFSAAARQLNRAQSAISQAMVALESVLDISLFDRSERLPKLTPEGVKLLGTARGIVRDADALKAHARNMAGGLEPELSIVLDTMFPQGLLTKVAREWAAAFP